MKRYEIKDREFPRDRGLRFGSLDAARRELAKAFPQSRFFILDREAKAEVA